jgi:hypothetical protein
MIHVFTTGCKDIKNSKNVMGGAKKMIVTDYVKKLYEGSLIPEERQRITT